MQVTLLVIPTALRAVYDHVTGNWQIHNVYGLYWLEQRFYLGYNTRSFTCKEEDMLL